MVTKEKLKVRLGLLQIVGDGFMRFAEAGGIFVGLSENVGLMIINNQ